MTLKEAIKFIELKYPQTDIVVETYDFEKNDINKIKQPKYLFRGESKCYAKTQTTFFRNLQNDLFDLRQWRQIQYATYHLYLFLRVDFFNIPITDDSHKNVLVEIYIVGLLRHYGFDTSFFDLTSDLNVVANFAANSEIGENGQLFVIPSENIIEYCYDLSRSPGDRPKKQKAFALLDFQHGTNLKDNEFLTEFSAEWIDFTLDKGDKNLLTTNYYYSAEHDSVAKSIIDWFDNSEIKLKLNDLEVIDYLNAKIKELRYYGG